jgi:hypothetical protein
MDQMIDAMTGHRAERSTDRNRKPDHSSSAASTTKAARTHFASRKARKNSLLKIDLRALTGGCRFLAFLAI